MQFIMSHNIFRFLFFWKLCFALAFQKESPQILCFCVSAWCGSFLAVYPLYRAPRLGANGNILARSASAWLAVYLPSCDSAISLALAPELLDRSFILSLSRSMCSFTPFLFPRAEERENIGRLWPSECPFQGERARGRCGRGEGARGPGLEVSAL